MSSPGQEKAFEGAGRLEGRVPRPVRTVVKRGLRTWGTATAGLRAPADFLVVGTKRGGTTTLYDALVNHPQVTGLFPRLERIKSPHYLTLEHARGSRWYRSHFPLRRPGGRPLAGDAAPYALYHPLAPARAAAESPDALVIAMLRDPVERAFSHHWDRVKNGVEDLSFEQAIEAEAGRLDGELARLLADPDTPRPRHEHFSYLDRGRYAVQLERWLEHFPAERIVVIRSEDFYAEPAEVFGRVCDALRIEPTIPERFGRHHAHRDRPKVEPRLRTELWPRFEQPTRELAELLGTRPWWDVDGPVPLDGLAVLHPPVGAVGDGRRASAQR